MIKSKWWTNKLYRMTSSYAKRTEIAELWSHWGMEAERMAVRQQELSYNWTMTLNAEPHIVREGKKVTKLQAGHSLCGTRQSSLQTSCRKEMGLRTVAAQQKTLSGKEYTDLKIKTRRSRRGLSPSDISIISCSSACHVTSHINIKPQIDRVKKCQ